MSLVNYEKSLQKILDIDEHIRFIGISDLDGDLEILQNKRMLKHYGGQKQILNRILNLAIYKDYTYPR